MQCQPPPWYTIPMKQPPAAEIRAEAIQYLRWHDAEPEPGPYHERTAGAMADFLLEARFADGAEACDWPEDFCTFYFETALATLLEMGLPA